LKFFSMTIPVFLKPAPPPSTTKKRNRPKTFFLPESSLKRHRHDTEMKNQTEELPHLLKNLNITPADPSRRIQDCLLRVVEQLMESGVDKVNPPILPVADLNRLVSMTHSFLLRMTKSNKAKSNHNATRATTYPEPGYEDEGSTKIPSPAEKVRHCILSVVIPFMLQLQHHTENLPGTINTLRCVNEVIHPDCINLLSTDVKDMTSIRQHSFVKLLPKFIMLCKKTHPQDLVVFTEFIRNLTVPLENDEASWSLFEHLVPDLVDIARDCSLDHEHRQHAFDSFFNFLRMFDETLQARALSMVRLGVLDMVLALKEEEFLRPASMLAVRLRLAGGFTHENAGETCAELLRKAYHDNYGDDYFVAIFLLALSPLTDRKPDVAVFTLEVYQHFEEVLAKASIPDICIWTILFSWLRYTVSNASCSKIISLFFINVCASFTSRLPVPAATEADLGKTECGALLEVFLHKIPETIDTLARILRKYLGEDKGAFVLDAAMGNFDDLAHNFYVTEVFSNNLLLLPSGKTT